MSATKIFTVVQAPILGQLGELTRTERRTACEVCGQQPPTNVEFLHYDFDYWEGEPLVNVADTFAVTPDLRQSIEAAELTGMTFRDMRGVYGDTYFEEEGDQKLPGFWHLSIDHRIEAGPGWWSAAGDCAECGLRKWKHTEFTVRAIVEAHRSDDIPRRTALRSSYQGWDVFYLDDPGPAVITQRFADLLTDQGVALDLQAAEFVDSI